MAIASKLLVLDLNGTLIYRNKGGSNSRVSYPRPYLGCFFKYLYRPLADENTPRPWEVFVWSSAQPHNVRTMLESTFDPEHIKGLWGDEVNEDEIDLEDGGKVLGVWARDKMGLSDQEYCMSLSLHSDHVTNSQPIKRKQPKTYERWNHTSNPILASSDSHSKLFFFWTIHP